MRGRVFVLSKDNFGPRVPLGRRRGGCNHNLLASALPTLPLMFKFTFFFN